MKQAIFARAPSRALVRSYICTAFAVSAAVALMLASPVAGAQQRVVGGPAPAASAAGNPAPGNAAPARPPAPAAAPMPSPKAPPDLVNEVIEAQVPLPVEEVLRLRRAVGERNAASTQNVTGRAPPRPTVQLYQLDLSPNATSVPPIVRVTPGQGAVVSFLDATGMPWPIVIADNANSDGGLKVSKFTAHQMSVFASRDDVIGNVLVGLEGLPTAVSFTVKSGQLETDYQVQMVVPRFKDGPPSNLISQSSLPVLGSSDLFDYLLMTPPANAKALKVDGLPGAKVWQTTSSRMVVRTEAQLSVALRHFSLDGIGVFEVPLSPVVTGTLNGSYVTLRVSGY